MHQTILHTEHNHIRWMIRRDMPEVMQIEASSEAAWTEEDFLRCLRQRNCIGMVVERGEKVVGFFVYELHKRKLEVLRFAVHPMFRRERIFSAMIRKLISKLSSHRRRKVISIVPDNLLPCHLAFKANGFEGQAYTRDTYKFVYTLIGETYDFGGEG